MTISKLKAVIIDDEELNIDTLDKILGLYCQEVVVPGYSLFGYHNAGIIGV
jgi:hypothetical protein